VADIRCPGVDVSASSFGAAPFRRFLHRSFAESSGGLDRRSSPTVVTLTACGPPPREGRKVTMGDSTHHRAPLGESRGSEVRDRVSRARLAVFPFARAVGIGSRRSYLAILRPFAHKNRPRLFRYHPSPPGGIFQYVRANGRIQRARRWDARLRLRATSRSGCVRRVMAASQGALLRRSDGYRSDGDRS
jgi:hypothetical protein